MSSWKTVKLSECAFFQEGYVNPSKLESSYFGGAIKWLRATDLNDGFVYDTSQTLTEKGFNSAGKSALLFEPNTIAISKSGTIGRLGILKDYMCGNRAVINIKTNPEKADSRFIFYVLRNNRSRIIELADGSVQKNLYTSALGKLEFKLPELEEQYNISSILSSMDEKIELNTQINQTLEQIAQTIFKSWFIDFDPVHAKANALASGQTAEQATQAAMAVISGKNTQELHRLQTANPEQYQQLWEIAEAFPSGFSGYKNLGEIPIGWNVLTFKDFISESKEKIGSLEDVPEYSVGNEGIYPRSEKYNKSLSKTPEKNKVVRIGDLVFGMGSKTLNWGIMNDEIGSVSPAYFVYRIFTNINYIYLNKYIKAKEYDFQNLIKPTSRQGQSVDKEMFLKKEIYVPNEYLLNIYLNKLKEIDSLVYSYTTEVLILEQIRDELLPKLLSGEI